MYAVLKGQDEHLIIEYVKNRKLAEKYLEDEKFLYSIAYNDEPEVMILKNKEYYVKAVEWGSSINTIRWRRLGNRLRQLIKDNEEKQR